MDFTRLKTLYPRASTEIFNEINKQLNEQSWSESSKFHFLAQCAHESGGFCILRENLNYSANGLLSVFPKYFNKDNVHEYARNPQKIANRVYANRMGNSDENSGDGWKYRGRGLIQITGRTNYTRFGHANDPEYLETTKGAVESAIWFWNTRRLFSLDDITLITKAVNGGVNGLSDRKVQYSRISNLYK